MSKKNLVSFGSISEEVTWLTVDKGARRLAVYLDQFNAQLQACCGDVGLASGLQTANKTLESQQAELQKLREEVAALRGGPQDLMGPAMKVASELMGIPVMPEPDDSLLGEEMRMVANF